MSKSIKAARDAELATYGVKTPVTLPQPSF